MRNSLAHPIKPPSMNVIDLTKPMDEAFVNANTSLTARPSTTYPNNNNSRLNDTQSPFRGANVSGPAHQYDITGTTTKGYKPRVTP